MAQSGRSLRAMEVASKASSSGNAKLVEPDRKFFFLRSAATHILGPQGN
jgi:hypothetical protein